MYNVLKGKKGIIFGALNEKSIAWQVALKCVEQGAEIVLTNAPIAIRMGETKELARICKAPLIPCDVAKNKDMEHLIDESMVLLGGKIDFVLHSIGMSLNIRKGNPYPNLDYKLMQDTLNISSLSLHRLLETCWQKDALNEWASVVALTYIGAQRIFPDYQEMADAKSLLESISRSFGYHYGKHRKVRVNTISQSPTMTTAGAGVKGMSDLYDYADAMSPLGNADAEECAAYCVSMFSDLTKKVTMQNLFHDGGFSSTGFSYDVIDVLKNAKSR